LEGNRQTNMLKKERQAFILHQVNLHNRVLSSLLTQEIHVSEDTIRRDLQELADEGKIIKVHGGALSHSFNEVSWPSNSVYLQDQKKIIAEKAASLISNGMFVLTSGGTTIIEMARALPPQLKATFVSGSMPAILEYMQHPNIDVILIGDRVSKNSKITIGAEAITKIKQIKADLCFLGINAIDIKHGITDNDWDVVQLKKAMVESSQKIVCLTIAEKINTLQPIHVCDISQIDILITELPPDDPVLRPYVNAGIQVL
jgi:DeoR/GlpR family transcriptional regulator of sugar metabolism